MTIQRYFNFIDDHVGLQLASIALLSLAMIPVCIGSFSSLHTMEKPQLMVRSTKRRHITKSNPFDDSDDEGEEKAQVLTIKDAFLFPTIGSALLYSVYIALNEVSPLYVDKAIQTLTSILSCAVFSNAAIIVLKNKLPFSCINTLEKYKFTLSKRGKKLFHMNVTFIHFFVLALSFGLTVTYAITQHWIIGNLFAISLAISCIGTLTVDSFITGFSLLSGMLAFDAFWLFGTDIMLNISNALSYAPTNIVWPRNINMYVFDKLLKSDQYFTSFGLGDIIVPGIFIAYCLRFDRLNSWKSVSHKRGSDFNFIDFSKPYFTSAMIAYGLSAGASIYVVHFTKKTQSALLFIVPALIVSTTVTALVRNELSSISNCENILKTFSKLSTFSADEDDEDERPVRFAKRAAATATTTRGKSTSTTRGRSTSVTRGSKGRSKSKGASRDQSKETIKNAAKQVKESLVDKAKDITPADVQDAVEEAVASTLKTTVNRGKRSSSRVSKKI